MLLDLDDTILDDSGNVSSCWLKACIDFRTRLEPFEPEMVFDAIERTRQWYWSDADRHRVGRLDLAAARREVVQLALQDLGIADEDLAAAIGDRYHLLRDHGLTPVEDAIATVEWLREQRCLLALLTNGSAAMQRDKISRFDLARLFEEILIEGEVGFGKPDPRIYVLALDRLGVEPTDAWMVGDNLEWDVSAPKRHGIAGIWIDLVGRGLPSGQPIAPDRIIRRLSDLREPSDA